MRKISLTLFAIALTAMLLPSCGKYEEGPAFSIIPKKSRIVNIWKIEKVFINDVDRSDLYQTTIDSYKLELTKDGKLTVSYTNSLGTLSQNGTWELESSNENLSFTINGDKDTFKIMRLKSNEMWLEETDAGQKFTTHYVSF